MTAAAAVVGVLAALLLVGFLATKDWGKEDGSASFTFPEGVTTSNDAMRPLSKSFSRIATSVSQPSDNPSGPKSAIPPLDNTSEITPALVIPQKPPPAIPIEVPPPTLAARSGPATPRSAPPGGALGRQWKNSLGMRFVPVPIRYGPTDGRAVLFSIWDTRVQDYLAFAQATARKIEKPPFEQESTHPAVMVSWDDAKAFCLWLTQRDQSEGKIGVSLYYRMPTDHEWSCAVHFGDKEDSSLPPAAIAGKVEGFPWGSQWPPPEGAGNYLGEGESTRDSPQGAGLRRYRDGYKNTSPVGSFTANEYGLYDMGGNVWQWCEDWYDVEHAFRVLRGASWLNQDQIFLRASARELGRTTTRNSSTGFRVVLVSRDQ